MSPLNARRVAHFRANRRAYWSLWIFTGLLVISLGAELIANDRPLLVWYEGRLLFPVFVSYPEIALRRILRDRGRLHRSRGPRR